MNSTQVSISNTAFDALAGQLARDMEADMVLSSPGYPAETTSVIGVHPSAELHFTDTTTPDEIKTFCFGSPGIAMGYVSYTYGMLLRSVTSDTLRDFPLGHLNKYGAVIEYDQAAGEARLSTEDAVLFDDLNARIASATAIAESTTVPGLPSAPPTVSLDRVHYEAGVRETLEHILSGYTYQLNLSTKFSWHCPDLDPLGLFLALRREHPAPFYAWFNSGPQRILSTSPERFLRVEEGHVLSQPIKGTLRFDAYAPELVAQLTESPKESAELSMIVDLIRNDISTHCEYGSVRVANHKSVFQVDNLLQMYSDVHGDLRQGSDCLDLFLDAFPGGSITGCPKKSSMEIIEKLEPHSRGIYCGSMVVIRDERTMDSSIAIRTGVYNVETGQLDSYAGSGIVVDSNPANEYQETMAKAEKFLSLGAS
ncbi:anthranilate synthase component I family protein [Pseudodesulfovibrio sp.]|nr:anthranilate synthase component I family protein [Pseudodesulfovibrio sp.]